MAAQQALLYAQLMRLHAPIGIWLLLWPTLWAVWIAGAGKPAPGVFTVFVLGTIVLRSAGCVFNDFADRKVDPYVERTAGRPIASGRVAPLEALVLFVGLMFIGLGLVMTMNTKTILLALVGALLTVVYPFMKRIVAAPQLILGLAFAWGVPMAYTATTDMYPLLDTSWVWLLYLCTIVWVLIYDTEYAMVDRNDDIELGVRSTAILFDEMDVTIVAALQVVLLLGLLLLGNSVELGLWFRLGLVAAACVAVWQILLIRDRERRACLRAFHSNAWYGGAVFAGILLDYIFRAG
jgi:4-hydroxybenzoate polyprenyltransferase